MDWGWEGWFVIAIVVAAFVGLVRGLPTDAVLLGATVLTALAGYVGRALGWSDGLIITPSEMLSGFANQGMLTVAALFVISAALRETGALDRIGSVMLGRARTEQGALIALAPQVVALSAFLNNTAVVAMLVKIVGDWCRKNRVSPSRLLMPLSYLAILGGMCTLIGTSTNLIVHGLMLNTVRKAQAAGEPPTLRGFELFDFAWVGVPLALLGIVYLYFVGRRLLPERKDLIEQFDSATRQYLVNMRIEPGCPLIGQRVDEAGLRRLPGLFLIEIARDGEIIAPVEPNQLLEEGDELTFSGAVETIVDLERIPGFVAIDENELPQSAQQRGARRYCEAVVSGTSPLLERTIREADFRARYNAAVIAVHRGGTRLRGRVGDIVLRPGDTILLQAGPHFAQAHRNDPSFFLVSRIDDARPVRHHRSTVAMALLGLLVLLMATGFLPTVVAAFFVAGLMVGFRCISASDARRNIAWDVLLTIAASFGLGAAMENTGVAAAVATQVVGVTQGWTGWEALATLGAIYLLTMVATEVITNNAAAVLLFPIAIASAETLDVSPFPFAITVALAASASFSTPIGYQTNMIIYGPGGYRFADFLRVGIPLNLLVWIAATLLIPLIWPFTPA